MKYLKDFSIPRKEDDLDWNRLVSQVNREFSKIAVALNTFIEEKTWKMGMSFGGGTTGITYSTNIGYYTKIGNMVFLSGHITLTSKGSSNGNALITGLPYTVYNNTAARNAPSLWFYNITFADQFQGYLEKGVTSISLWEITNAGVLTSLTDANFAADSQIIISGFYRVA